MLHCKPTQPSTLSGMCRISTAWLWLWNNRWLGGLAARAFDLRLNGHEFETQRPLALPGSNHGQITHTYELLSPSSITWYRCKSWGGNSRLWKRCGLPSTMPSASLLPAQDHGNGDEHCTLLSYSLYSYTDRGLLYLYLFTSRSTCGLNVLMAD